MAGEGGASWQGRENPQKEIGVLLSREGDQMLDRKKELETSAQPLSKWLCPRMSS